MRATIGKRALRLTGILPILLLAAHASPAMQSDPPQPIGPDPSLTKLTIAAPEQPLPFSHKLHAASDIQCQNCHASPENQAEISLPSTEKCMVCHRSIAKDQPAIQALAKYSQENKPIPWVQVYSVSALAFWSHASHTAAGLSCAACHGDIAAMDKVSAVTNVTTMAGCVACHTAKQAPTGCLVCHDLQSARLGWETIPRPQAPNTPPWRTALLSLPQI